MIDIIKNELGDYIVGIEKIEGRDPEFEDFKFKNEILNEYLYKINFKLYKHQKMALELLYNKKNVIVSTGTASGKSYIFRLYIIDRLLSDKSKTFLLIYPLRALLYDQYEKFNLLINDFKEKTGIELPIKMKFILGDLSAKDKEKMIKERPNIILTTVDNLHLYLLKNHDRLFYFFKNLDLIVVDELHTYRGVFGTNSFYVFRRLQSLLEFYYKNKEYKILGLSATLKDPKEFASKFFNREFYEISKDYSKRYERYIIGIDPKNSPSKPLLKRIINILLKNDIKSLVFIESKKGVELSKLSLQDIDIDNKIYTYKASYTRDVRREIEEKFKRGEYKILITTSALELGIDIGDIICVVNYGIPRDGLFSLIQRFGRSGRSSTAYNIIIFKKDALDFYYSSNFKELIDRISKNKIESIPLNVYNENIVRKHLIYLINELGRIDENILNEYEKEILRKLENDKLVKKIKDPLFGKEYYKLNIQHPIIYNNLRNISGKSYFLISDKEAEEIVKNVKKKESAIKIINMLKSKGKILEEIDEVAFYEYLLPGMVYYSAGKILRVREHYKIGDFVFIFADKEEFYSETSPLYLEDVKILDDIEKKNYGDWEIHYGMIKVKKEYIGYIEKIKYSEEIIQNIHYYDNPIVREFNTKAIWIILPDEYKSIEEEYFKYFSKKLEEYLEKKKYNISKENIYAFISSIDKDIFYEKYRGLASRRIKEIIEEYLGELKNDKMLVFLIKKLIDYQTAFKSGIHAIEHNIIKISPIVTLVDSKELGGYSYPIHPQTGKPTIFIYEGYENGVGLAEILYKNIEKLINRSIKSIFSCKCLDGCPRCIFSPKCGNYNEYLDKYSARFIYKLFRKKYKSK